MSPEQTAAALDAIPQPLVLIGADMRIAAMNARASELFRVAGIGRHYATVLRNPAVLDAIDAVLKGDRPGTARFYTGDSREGTWRVSAIPVRGDGGMMLSFEDVTDVEHAGQMRRDFVTNVSHELKTPLTALLGFIETLRGPAREDAAARDRFLEIMEKEAARMNRLVSDLLSLSRVETTERLRPTEKLSLREIAGTVVNAVRPMADAADVVLRLETEEGLETSAFDVMGDPDQLQQIVLNLVENAIKYGASGGEVTIRLSLREREAVFRGPGVQLDVIDKGEGFDPIHIPRLTERFYRVDTHRSREQGGTGLGLAIVKHIVSRHRGRFRIESAPGEGATFTILLPAA
ncbi:ATP-binding protein [Roseicyclus sp. F158]|uniref:histidine kinase n=1 Tax=Tropicimonas omnivorans TaxID=3075590 RepID=A0ABU3DJM0_9RHOB|nr:ATP-binding protein [Roseicyclus sp. F158]MDT0683911.1 ATP-binding protein [Roseicyclus sp. F158]